MTSEYMMNKKESSVTNSKERIAQLRTNSYNAEMSFNKGSIHNN